MTPPGPVTEVETVSAVPNVIGLEGVNDAAPTVAVALFTVKVPDAAPVPEL